MRRRWLKIGIAACALVVAPLGVRFLVAPVFIGQPDSVHIVVTRVNNYSDQHGSVIFDHEFSQQAAPVYAELVTGGPLPDMPASCPIILENRPYYRYELTFFRWDIVTAQATDDAIGCMYFSVRYPLGATEGYSWYRGDSHPTFWVRLYELTNAPQPQ